ncbi:MAG: hypothetical protein AMXMBFR57_25590 [Acidimicrobiia bacterium]
MRTGASTFPPTRTGVGGVGGMGGVGGVGGVGRVEKSPLPETVTPGSPPGTAGTPVTSSRGTSGVIESGAAIGAASTLTSTAGVSGGATGGASGGTSIAAANMYGGNGTRTSGT